MLRRVFSHPTYANVLATLALFIAPSTAHGSEGQGRVLSTLQAT